VSTMAVITLAIVPAEELALIANVLSIGVPRTLVKMEQDVPKLERLSNAPAKKDGLANFAMSRKCLAL